MRYALTTFALIITLVGGFIFGAYYMYNKYNPKAEEQAVAASTEEESIDESLLYDADGNWIFKYDEDESGYGGNSTTVSAGGQASENIDYRITGTNFVYEDDGYYSGFHAVVTVENIGSNNLYLGKDSVFNIEDRNLNVVDSYDYVRSVPDVIAPGEKGYFYVPYGQIKTREDSVTIDEGQLSGDVLDIENDATRQGSMSTGEDVNAVDIDELEKALGIGDTEEGTDESGEDTSASKDTSASIKVDAPKLLAAATEEASSGELSSTEDGAASDKSESDSADTNKEAAEDTGKAVEAADSNEGNATDSEASEGNDGATSDADSTEGTTLEDLDGTEGSATTNAAEEAEEKEEYPGLSLYRVHEYFIMPVLDVEKCANDPKTDFDIQNIIYGSNADGYFALSADVTNDSENNVDYVPVTVVALDRRGNAIAVGKDSINDFYKGATKSFGISYVLTREERSNIVQCVIYAREVVNK
ncbi:MAG: hypothetical protein E7302_04195 [Butyrivibrio sp.]|nr:hypothetical protein [Butyrivibrio sp.]